MKRDGKMVYIRVDMMQGMSVRIYFGDDIIKHTTMPKYKWGATKMLLKKLIWII